MNGEEQTHQSRAPPLHPPTRQTPHNIQTQQTHQSSRNNISLNNEEDLRGHPFTDEIIDTQLPPKWKRLTIKPYDGSTYPYQFCGELQSLNNKVHHIVRNESLTSYFFYVPP